MMYDTMHRLYHVFSCKSQQCKRSFSLGAPDANLRKLLYIPCRSYISAVCGEPDLAHTNERDASVQLAGPAVVSVALKTAGLKQTLTHAMIASEQAFYDGGCLVPLPQHAQLYSRWR